MESVDTILRGEFLVSSPSEDDNRGWCRDGAVAIRGGEVVASGTWQEISSLYITDNIHYRKSGIIMPGLINAHTHAPMVLFRGIADDLPLKIWLEEHIFPAEADLTPDLVSLGAELACAEMIKCGTTAFADMYLFESSVVEVAVRAGLRIWAGEGIFDFPSPAFENGYLALEETERLFEQWKDHELVTINIDPHTPYTCSPELLEACAGLSSRTGMGVVTHVAETLWEDQEIRKKHNGMSPVAYLDSLGLLNEKLLAVHCVVLDAQDIKLLADRGASVAHCPESNLKLASGIAPVPELLEAGVTTALGTDGAASNNDLNMLSEMDTAAKIHKGITRNPECISAGQALSMATSMAADALGRTDIGRIEPGCRADIVIVDLDTIHMRPCFNPVSQIVYAAGPGDVQDVMVNGRFLMTDRKLLTIDEDAILEKAAALAKNS